jgi:ribosome-binding ATPase YchF (GTP1/OBG family)
VLVLRAFSDTDVMGPTDPLEHLATVETELALADLASVEGKVERHRKQMKLDKSPALAVEVAALDAALAALSEGTPDLPRRPVRGAPRRPAAVVPADEQAGPGGGQHR